MDSFRDEVKRCAACHRDGRACMMRQHKDRRVKRRVFTPPAFPVLVWPRAANRAKHIAAQNPRSDVLDAARRKIIVYSSCARFFAVQQLLKRGGWEKPLVYIQTPDAIRIAEALFRPGGKSIEGQTEAWHAQLTHRELLNERNAL